ncbi:MAG: hypothetical protein LBG87_06955 [Spirochaetaceae bacterium]|jgi:ribonucleoside-triphosphate reductase|nr:hypothetical protein [Spirochaetaceae bacterium]
MRSLEEIERELASAKEARSRAEGTPAEVYSRIVGYYRSVRNWNKGKREEYGERLLYRAFEPRSAGACASCSTGVAESGFGARKPSAESAGRGSITVFPSASGAVVSEKTGADGDRRILLFVRPACPNCPPVKDAAGRLGIPVDLVNTDTADGFEEAARRNVQSTPTAILLAGNGAELGRARDSGALAAFGKRLA